MSAGKHQRGQVLVIVALMMVAMVGALGLAIDGGRLYVDRRVLQNAVDATALGAADTYSSSLRGTAAPACPAGSSSAAAVTAAYSVGLAEFAAEVHRSTGDFTASGADPAITYTSSAAVGDVYTLVLSRSVPSGSVDPAACAFKASASHPLSMAFIQVLNGVGTTSVQTTAQAISAQNLIVPGALLFLLDPSSVTAPGQADCGSGTPNDTLAPAGTGSLTIDGSMMTDGNLQMWTSNAYQMTLNPGPGSTLGGQIFDHCDGVLSGKPTTNITWNGSPSGPRFHGHVNHIADPFGPAPGIDWAKSSKWFGGDNKPPYTSTSPTCCDPTTAVELDPGIYTSDPGFNKGCWFLEPGIYTWNQGLRTDSGTGLVSNELGPPAGETPPAGGNGQPFSWNGGNLGFTGTGPGDSGCIGQIKAYGVACASNCVSGSVGTVYYFRVAAVRAEKAPPSGATACSSQPAVNSVAACWRQSYLSNATLTSGCIAVPWLPSTNIQIGLSNVPGMGNKTFAQTGDAHTQLLDSRYDIFASKVGCDDSNSWGYVTSASFGTNTGTQTPSNLSSCPSLPATEFTANADKFLTSPAVKPCGLGYIGTAAIDGTALPSTWSPAAASSCTIGPAPTPGVGVGKANGCNPWYTNSSLCSQEATCDAANEDYCLAASGSGYCNFLTPNANGGDVTPGGVLFYTPISAGPPPNGVNCIKMTNSGTQTFAYGTALLYDIVFYAPNNCPITLEGGRGGAYVGWGYMPGSTDLLTLLGNGTPIQGGIDLWAMVIGGGANITLTGDIPSFPIVFPLSTRLIRCTNTTPGCPNP